MKKITLLIVIVLGITINLYAAYFSNLPYTITQPNGEKIDCFVSGDEFFNWIHDKEGYTIIQAPDGYFYYGETSSTTVIPTKYKVNSVDPNTIGLEKWAKITVSEYKKAQLPYATETVGEPISNAPHTGTLNNIVIYIRFSDDAEFTNTRQTFDDKFNAPAPGISIKSYYDEVSYSQFNINSTHYPECAMTTNLSYKDSHPRGYFQPYNATTNTIGYEGGNSGSERTSREHTLLKDAIDWVNTNSPVSPSLDLDADNDGKVDNVCFNIVGTYNGWASLLWAHSWSLYSQSAYINGKRVYKYTFQPETQIVVRTLCHEMFHAVGAPDLYHYTGNGISPVSSWDIMEQGSGHMGAYMKWKYANQTWITEIPEITTSGTYTLNPLTSSTNNCFKIPSLNNSSQFYVVEYRKKEGTYESNIPGSGLLVYRIDPSQNGNANGPPDEVYIYRPDGTTTANGSPASAYFSSETGRTAINDASNPSGFLQDGSLGGLNISNVTSAGNTISFDLTIDFISDPSNFTATAYNERQIDLDWQKNAESNDVMLIYNTTNSFDTPVDGLVYAAGSSISGNDTVIYVGSNTNFNHLGLDPKTTYYYKLFSLDKANNYSEGIIQYSTTPCGIISSFPWSEGFENEEIMPDCWEQQMSSQSDGWWIQNGNGGSNPATAHSGNFNAYLRDFTIDDDISLLITPAFDLSSLDNPVLSFWHTQVASTSNQDQLTVFYKSSIRGEWTKLTSYTSNISTWTQESILLPNTSSTYYINFEGNAKAGLGICLDDVEINDMYTVPTTLEVRNDTINNGESFCYNANQTITVAGNSSIIELLSGSSTNFIAGESISFLPGFHAHSGSDILAYITNTADFCDTQPAPIVSNGINIKSTFLDDEIKDENLLKEKTVKVYPNPNNGQFKVDIQNFEETTHIQIINSNGTIIYKNTAANGIHEIELTNLNRGLYFITISSGKTIKTNKIIIQ